MLTGSTQTGILIRKSASRVVNQVAIDAETGGQNCNDC